MTFKEFAYECEGCGARIKRLRWAHEPLAPCEACGGDRLHETSIDLRKHRGVIDDQLEGGARWCETMGHEPVWLDGTKSQWRKEVAKRGLTNVVKHDSAYYAKQRKLHDERKADTGSAYDQSERQPARGPMQGW